YTVKKFLNFIHLIHLHLPQPAIVKPEGRIFFAGDHTTLYHGWIQGAIESGIRINSLSV
ncbi:FAD-dependent oxidoreductase, partial [Bacillus sp. B-TM1]